MQADEALGLEREGTTLRGAFVRYQKGLPSLQNLFTTQIQEEKGLPLPLQEPPFSKGLLDRVLIITGLPPEETLIRPLEIKLTKTSDVDTVLAFQAEPLLPYPIEQAYIDRWILGKTDDATQVSVLAVRKELVQNHLKWYQDHLHLDPERVSTDSSALALFANWYAPTKGLMLILHLGRENGLLLLAEEGKVLAAQGPPLTISSLWNAPTQEKATEDITSVQPQATQNNLETLRQWLIRTLFAFTKQVKGRDIPTLLYTGEGANNTALLTHINEWLGKELIELSPPSHADLERYDRPTLLTYAIPIGLACSAFPDAKNGDPIQLRQGEDAYTNPWKRLKKPFLAFTAAALLCAFALYTWNKATTHSRQHRLQAEYSALLAKMGRDAEDIEKQFNEPLIPTPQGCLSLNHLSPLSINKRIAFLEKEDTQIPDVFPLQPNMLRVSDLLAWLSGHPNATEIHRTTGEKIPLFQVTSLNYQMTKRPDRNKPTEHYQVKVDLELQSNDSKGPRELYDALLEPNEVVDPTNPVTWAAGQGKYRITFYLKDHTVYP